MERRLRYMHILAAVLSLEAASCFTVTTTVTSSGHPIETCGDDDTGGCRMCKGDECNHFVDNRCCANSPC